MTEIHFALGNVLGKLTWKVVKNYDTNRDEAKRYELVLASPLEALEQGGVIPAQSISIYDYEGKRLQQFAKAILEVMGE